MTEVGYRSPYKVDPPTSGGNKKLFHSQDDVSSTSLVQYVLCDPPGRNFFLIPPLDTVTGASSGFGLSLTTYALEQGDIVIATVRKPETLKHLLQVWTKGQLLILKVDVSNPDDIKDAFRTTEIRFGRIDVVYNNAGSSLMGELESTPEEEARKMFEVNFWGAVNVAREAIRFFRDINKPQGGRLWSVTSAAGLFPLPAFGYYCASKFGMPKDIFQRLDGDLLFCPAHEGAISTLATEVDPEWNIKVRPSPHVRLP